MISPDQKFAKALRRLETCLLVNCNLCGELVLSSELLIIFHDNPKTISVSFSIADFNLLSCEFDSFTYNISYCLEPLYMDIIFDKIKLLYNTFHNTATVPCEKSKTVSFGSSRIKNILVLSSPAKLAVKSTS